MVNKSLGSLNETTKEAIRKNSLSISKILKKAQRMNGYGLGKQESDVISIKESIEILNKENGLMNDDEIKAWVYYKRTLGIPMTGWEKYFTKGKGKNEKILVTIRETEIKDKNNIKIKIVPAGSQIGSLCFVKESEEYYYFTDKTGYVCSVQKSNVRLVENAYTADQSEIDKMVNDGVLFYNNGRYVPYPIYVYANMYDRILELEEDRDFIEKKYGKRVYENHKKIIDENKPKQLSFLDPIKENRPSISPLSKYSKEFEIVELDDNAPFELILQEETGISLTEAYEQFLKSNLPRDYFMYPNIQGYEIYRIIFLGARKERGQDEEEWQMIKGRCQSECERMFSVFIEKCLTTKDKMRLDIDWNRKFNGFPPVPSNKVPIALPMSRIVKGGTFELRPAQREGVAFIELTQSGCISFDVGVGKTFTAIAEVACAMQQGKCKRPIIVVPNSTYQNWISEIIGKGSVKGLLAGTGIKLSSWFNLGAGIAANEKDVQDGTITLITKEGLKKFGFSDDFGEMLKDDLKSILSQNQERMKGRESAKFNESIDSILGKGQKNGKLDFDKCGFDYIVLDEAHNYKNIFSKILPDSSIKSMNYHASSGKPSDLGLKGFIFCNYIQRMYGGNVMLLTATPFTNTPLEIYSMLSLVAMDELFKRNINNVNRFFETFVNEEYDEIVDASLNIRHDFITKSFRNRMILQSLIYSNFDYKTGEEAGVKRPNKINIPLLYKGGKILQKEKQILSYLKMTDRQTMNQEIINYLINTANSGSGTGGDSTFSGMGNSLNNALSPFLFKVPGDVILKVSAKFGIEPSVIQDEINRDPEDYIEFINESPKIKYACECIKSVKDYHQKRGENCSGQIIYADRGKDFFGYIKTYLENDCGFKKGLSYLVEDIEDINGKKKTYKVDEVEIISGGISETKKDLLMRAFNDGVIKVIIGTSTIKEGVNLQRRSTVLYNLYPNWNPTDIQQIEGRLYRQGNTFQYVRIVMPLMQNSMDVFVFQKLQDKTDRINDIWYRVDRGNVLNVDSLDPKEVKFALITDIKQLVNNQIRKEQSDLTREISILNDEFKALNSFKSSFNSLNLFREKTLDSIRKSLENMGRYIPVLSNRPTDDDLKKMSSEERNKALKLIERYDELMRFIHQPTFDNDKEIVQMSRKLANIYDTHFTYYTDEFSKYIKEVAKTEDSVLRKRGFNRNSDLSILLEELNAEANKLKDEQEFVNSEAHYKEVEKFITDKKKEMNIIGKSIDDRIKEFKKTNYVMQYPFNPLLVQPNNEMPEINEKDDEEDDEQDDVDEIELMEMEAEALTLMLKMMKI